MKEYFSEQIAENTAYLEGRDRFKLGYMFQRDKHNIVFETIWNDEIHKLSGLEYMGHKRCFPVFRSFTYER